MARTPDNNIPLGGDCIQDDINWHPGKRGSGTPEGHHMWWEEHKRETHRRSAAEVFSQMCEGIPHQNVVAEVTIYVGGERFDGFEFSNGPEGYLESVLDKEQAHE